MIDDSTEVTTAEICLLCDLVKSRLGHEASGIIRRAGKDRWPLAATMRALFGDARARSAAYSSRPRDASRWRAPGRSNSRSRAKRVRLPADGME